MRKIILYYRELKRNFSTKVKKREVYKYFMQKYGFSYSYVNRMLYEWKILGMIKEVDRNTIELVAPVKESLLR